jgi:hypothetical protein
VRQPHSGGRRSYSQALSALPGRAASLAYE